MISIRASSLPTLIDCPARWQSIHIQGRHTPTTDKAQLGLAVHASTAVYDQAVIDGSGITAEDAKAAAVDVIHHPDEEVTWEDTTPQDAPRHLRTLLQEEQPLEHVSCIMHRVSCILLPAGKRNRGNKTDISRPDPIPGQVPLVVY